MTPSTPAAPAPPLRLGIVGTGLALQQLHWPALRQSAAVSGGAAAVLCALELAAARATGRS